MYFTTVFSLVAVASVTVSAAPVDVDNVLDHLPDVFNTLNVPVPQGGFHRRDYVKHVETAKKYVNCDNGKTACSIAHTACSTLATFGAGKQANCDAVFATCSGLHGAVCQKPGSTSADTADDDDVQVVEEEEEVVDEEVEEEEEAPKPKKKKSKSKKKKTSSKKKKSSKKSSSNKKKKVVAVADEEDVEQV